VARPGMARLGLAAGVTTAMVWTVDTDMCGARFARFRIEAVG